MALAGAVDGGASKEVSLGCRAWSLCALDMQPWSQPFFSPGRTVSSSLDRQAHSHRSPVLGLGCPDRRPAHRPSLHASPLPSPSQSRWGCPVRDHLASRGGPKGLGNLERCVGNLGSRCPQTSPGHRHQ